MLEWLKWFVARKEMTELHLWRLEYEEHRRWLAEFQDVGAVLDRVRARAQGEATCSIYEFRDHLRNRSAS